MDASSAPLFQKILLDLDRLGKIDWSSLTRKQFKVLSDIMKCHTEACGMNCDVCEECGFTQYHYCSCNNPNCPLCGALGRERWVENQRQYVLNERYYHMVFTIPHELNWLCLLDPEQMYRLLFKAVSSVLLEAGRDPEFLGGQAGFTCVLHTWGQKMDLHPHIHVIFCGGVAADQQTWQRPRRKNGFLYPVAKLRSAFKKRYLSLIREEFDHRSFTDRNRYSTTLHKCANKKWNVEIRESTASPDHVIKYLGRYVNRTAISAGRIEGYDGEYVTIRYKDYKDHSRLKTMKLKAEEFLRRFLMHILPPYFCAKRHYGFLGNSVRKKLIPVLRKLTGTAEPVLIDKQTSLAKVLGDSYPHHCPKCEGPMFHLSRFDLESARIVRRE